MKDATLLKCSEFADEINHGMIKQNILNTWNLKMNIFCKNHNENEFEGGTSSVLLKQ